MRKFVVNFGGHYKGKKQDLTPSICSGVSRSGVGIVSGGVERKGKRQDLTPSMQSQSMGPADAKMVFRNALMLGAAKIVLAHNHPSGSLKPSKHDIEFTNRIIEVGRLMDLPLVDHVIYSASGYSSMRAEDVCGFEPFV